ncbi:hypothetical protein PG991_007944 [Apiospora marii]|uniref:Uncharacterized protein n=1 Tax=Apiospora marii TaxID=335849 RepID=A0ABR1RW52_9PEZI
MNRSREPGQSPTSANPLTHLPPANDNDNMGLNNISLCLYVAFWLRSVQERAGEITRSLVPVAPDRQKEVDLEKAMANGG